VSAETDPGLDRMRSVLWFIAVVAWGIAAGVMMDAIFDEKWLVFVTAVLIAGLGAALYARERRSLQLIAMSIPIFAAAAALLYMTKSQSYFGYSFDVPNLRWSGLITALLGAAWLAVGFADIVHPKRTMMVLGALAFLLGVNVLVGDTGSVYGLGASTGVGTSVALLIASVILVFVGDRAEVLAVIGIGIFGSLTSVTQLVSANVHGTGPALVVLVAGLLVVGGGLLLIKPFGDGRLLGRPAPPPPPPS
jgi:hypothetical protein